MRYVLLKLLDCVTTVLCSVGPLRFIGNWWWRKRLGAVHENLPMESYLSRSQAMRSVP
jgi:hypothetical protein